MWVLFAASVVVWATVIVLSLPWIDEAWCRLMHRRFWWTRMPGLYVCDKCGREWRE